MGVASYIYRMFLRKLKNRSGSISVQIISKSGRNIKLLRQLEVQKPSKKFKNCGILANKNWND